MALHKGPAGYSFNRPGTLVKRTRHLMRLTQYAIMMNTRRNRDWRGDVHASERFRASTYMQKLSDQTASMANYEQNTCSTQQFCYPILDAYNSFEGVRTINGTTISLSEMASASASVFSSATESFLDDITLHVSRRINEEQLHESERLWCLNGEHTAANTVLESKFSSQRSHNHRVRALISIMIKHAHDLDTVSGFIIAKKWRQTPIFRVLLQGAKLTDTGLSVWTDLLALLHIRSCVPPRSHHYTLFCFMHVGM